MHSSWPIKLLWFSLLGFLGCHGSQEKQATLRDRPNIIFVLADDLGYGDLGCFGQQKIKTPHIDALAAEGMRFLQHYAGATVCAPSRASLLTGLQPGRSPVRGNTPKGQKIHAGTETFASALKAVGYKTAIIGKWGIGNGLPLDDPLQLGFDEHLGYINMWHAHNFYPEFLIKNGRRIKLEGNQTNRSLPYPKSMPEGAGVASVKTTYAPNQFKAEAISFIEKYQSSPFLLFLSLNMPHANNEAGQFMGDGMEVPMQVREGQTFPQYHPSVERAWPNPEKGFATMQRIMDNMVGQIVETLRRLNIEKNTIVVFSSDNGPHQEGKHEVAFFDSNGSLRGHKRDLYEGGIRVPLIVKWPQRIQAGSASDHLCAFWDILPTFCDLAGAPKHRDIDGISFAPILLGGEQKEKHDFLYWEFYEQGGKQAVRSDHWKYIKLNVRDNLKETIIELYDLDNDPSETNNIATQYPNIVNKMETILESAHERHPLITLIGD